MARLRQGKGSGFALVQRAVKRARRWRGNQNNQVLPALASIDVTLLAPADYEQSTTLEPSGVTMGGIRGAIAINADVASLPLQGAWYIIVVDQGETIPATVDSVTLTDEDVLVCGAFSATVETPWIYELNVKVLRKLHNDRLILTVDSNTGGTGIVQTVTRTMCLGG